MTNQELRKKLETEMGSIIGRQSNVSKIAKQQRQHMRQLLNQIEELDALEFMQSDKPFKTV